MPTVYPLSAPEPRAALGWDGTAYRVLGVDAAGHTQVDTLSSALPAGAATAANQLTEITALQLIDDLRAALHSVNTDELVVRGADQLWSYKRTLIVSRNAPLAGAGGYIDSDPCPAGEIWCVTNVASYDLTTATTVQLYFQHQLLVQAGIGEVRAAIPIGQGVYWHGMVWLDAAGVIRVQMVGGANLDNCYVQLTGHRMTLQV